MLAWCCSILCCLAWPDRWKFNSSNHKKNAIASSCSIYHYSMQPMPAMFGSALSSIVCKLHLTNLRNGFGWRCTTNHRSKTCPIWMPSFHLSSCYDWHIPIAVKDGGETAIRKRSRSSGPKNLQKSLSTTICFTHLLFRRQHELQ